MKGGTTVPTTDTRNNLNVCVGSTHTQIMKMACREWGCDPNLHEIFRMKYVYFDLGMSIIMHIAGCIIFRPTSSKINKHYFVPNYLLRRPTITRITTHRQHQVNNYICTDRHEPQQLKGVSHHASAYSIENTYKT